MEELETELAAAGITLPAPDYEQFRIYLELLLRWNARLNLTAIRKPEEVLRRHFVESIFVARHLPAGTGSLLDYGSGAGFPGIPIAICDPSVRVVLAEAQGKKASFLREVVRTLHLDAEVYGGRVEHMPEERSFDAVTMRAVEKMETALPVAACRARRHLVLLTTVASLAGDRHMPGFTWLEPIALPNTVQMIMSVGCRGESG